MVKIPLLLPEPENGSTPVKALSGGNQQKVILSAIVTKIKYGSNFFSINIKDIALPGEESKYVLYGSIIDILNRASELIILATGMTIVMITGGIDISVGSYKKRYSCSFYGHGKQEGCSNPYNHPSERHYCFGA